jgi:multidrug efflux system membrane fusion protein
MQNAYALEVKGRLEWVHKTDMRILVDGVVEKVNVIVGQHVKKGDLLLQLDQREFKANVEEAKARVAQAKLETEAAERENQRMQELFERGLMSIEDQKTVELQVATAKARQASAEAALTRAEIALERTELKAPFNGVIVTRNVWAGDVLYKTMQSTPLLSLAPANKMLARALVSSKVLQQYRKGQGATVNVRGNNYKGKIYQMGVEAVRIEPEGAIYELDISFNPSAKTGLRPTESATILLP